MEYLKVLNKSSKNYFEENPLLFNHLKKNNIYFNKIKNEPNFRAYKDESTSVFVSTFLKDEDILNYFIYYNFQTIHYFIISNLNKMLNTNNEILKSDEDIFILFKGGNTIHFYFEKILQQIKEGITETNPEYLEKINELNKYFKTSDVDTTVYIINKEETKFNVIYYWITILLNKSLIFIRSHFDNILNKTETYTEKKFDQLSNQLIYFEESRISNNNILQIDIYKIHEIYRNISQSFEKFVNKDYQSENFLINDMVKNINNFYSEFDDKFIIFKDCYIGSRYILIIDLIKFYYDTNIEIKKILDSNKLLSYFIKNFSVILKYQDSAILTLLSNKLSKLNDFYNKEKINQFIETLTKNFNTSDYQDKHFYNTNTNPSVKFVINKPIKKSDIVILPRNDFLFRNVNSPEFNNLIFFPEKSTHFISINNVISNYVGSEHIVTFDLYRVKFNLRLNKIFNVNKNSNMELNIPSEFLDISIPKFYDYNLSIIREKLYNSTNMYINYFSKLDNSKTGCYNVLSTNLKYTIKDLNSVLYEQNTFLPWNDNKYNKRIIRLLLVIFVLYYKKSVEYKCTDFLNSVLNEFIENLRDLSIKILLWISNKNTDNKNNVLASINKIIFFNDSSNNILNVNTLRNFYDYQNKLFFKIKYYNLSDPKLEVLSHVFHEELDISINIITKIIFFIVEDRDVYLNFIEKNLERYNYVFSSVEEKNDYINNKFLKEYVDFIEKFITNLSFIKNVVFNNIKPTTDLQVEDILIGGMNNFVNITKNSIKLNYLKISDIKVPNLINYTNLNNTDDIESFEMIN